jgi:hypothetical protein
MIEGKPWVMYLWDHAIMDYRDVKKANEQAAISSVLCRHNGLFRRKLAVIARPDPPDALAKDDGGCVWIEACNAYYSGDWARDLHSFAATDKNHVPISSNMHVNMDDTFCDVFWRAVFRKDQKEIYDPFVVQYGKGLLVVGLEHPWLDGDLFPLMHKVWEEKYSRRPLSRFAELYVYWRESDGTGRADRWPFGKLDRRRFARGSARLAPPSTRSRLWREVQRSRLT